MTLAPDCQLFLKILEAINQHKDDVTPGSVFVVLSAVIAEVAFHAQYVSHTELVQEISVLVASALDKPYFDTSDTGVTIQ